MIMLNIIKSINKNIMANIQRNGNSGSDYYIGFKSSVYFCMRNALVYGIKKIIVYS